MKKCGRNDPCPCGSGKKFKKCCESTMIGGRYKATKVDSSNTPQIATATRMTGFFHAHVSQAKPSDATKPIKPSDPAPETPPPDTETKKDKTGEES